MARQYLARRPSLPLPGRGHTLARWQCLAQIAAEDVCLAKILEAHYDAQAILAELGGAETAADQLLAVWAAETPRAVVEYRRAPAARVAGTKAWCSGAAMVDQALLTAQSPDGQQLVLIQARGEGVELDDHGWHAVGMGRVVSGAIRLNDVAAIPVGGPAAYLDRPGFWHGGAGIAACWFGAAKAIAETLRRHVGTRRDDHGGAHLGRLDMGLGAAAALLRETAALIDLEPRAAHQREVLRLRSVVERVATDVIDRVGRALGPGPLCGDAGHALRCADLSVFIRQSHAERDWASLGGLVAEVDQPWELC